MKKDGDKFWSEKLINFFLASFQYSWFELLEIVWGAGAKITHHFSASGLYEVLEFESTLELLDPNGICAKVSKRQKVRYLQDHIIAYQDQAWGDGEILIDYKCIPGVLVDQYQFGHKTINLISLREEKNRDSIDDIRIIWRMNNSFLREKESWATSIQHKTNQLRVNLIFPKSRPPKNISLVECKTKKVKKLGDELKTQLPDERWLVTWQCNKPILNEEYILEWKW